MARPAKKGGHAPRAGGARAVIRTLAGAGSAGVDPVIHSRVRLAMLSALAVNRSCTFGELKRLLETTDGNLSVHARRLEDEGYISCTKAFEGRTPRTEYRLLAKGRRALDRYLSHMEALVRAMREHR